MSLYRDAAVVLRTYRLGEADRIVVLLTRGRGKVRAVAKGVRRTRSKFGSRLEPGSYIQVQLFEGRGELDIVTQAETIEPFRRSREDLTRMSQTSSLLEAIDQLAQDGESSPRLHDMLVGGLRTIDSDAPAMLVAAFYLKLLALEGVAPELDLCVECGDPTDDGNAVLLSIESGGVRCGSCGGGRRLSAEALTVSRAVLGGGLRAVLDLPSGPLTNEVESMATAVLEVHLERRLRSVRVLHDA